MVTITDWIRKILLRQTHNTVSTEELFKKNDSSEKYYFFGEDIKTIKNIIAPNAVDSTPDSYIIINDAGIDIYCISLYIDKLPKDLTVATSFTPLFNYEGVVSTVHIKPLLDESIIKANKRVEMLDSELLGAQKNGESINRIRKLRNELDEAQSWASKVESGHNQLYEVQFLFLLQANSLLELQKKVFGFQEVAKKKRFELLSCYKAQKEAFISSMPLNMIKKVSAWKGKGLNENPVKKHYLDKLSLSTIYNHTNTEFFHQYGVLFGRNLFTGMPICFDPYDSTHSSYGIIVAGQSGHGKSATMKELFSRLVDFDYHIITIDFEPLPGEKCGEYAPYVKASGGNNITFGHNQSLRLNFFEINEEKEYDKITDCEFRTLHVADKVVELTHLLIVMATHISAEKSIPFSAETITRMNSILKQSVKNIYDHIGLVEGDANSLYEESRLEDGYIGAGVKRKRLPQFRDFFMDLLEQSIKNKDEFKSSTYSLLIDVFADMVEELYYCPHCLEEYTREEYERLKINGHEHAWCPNELPEKQIEIKRIKGTLTYFDAQSSVYLNFDTPCTNFDLSQIPSSIRPMFVLVAQNFVEENFIKLNSTNPKLARRLIFCVDESQKMLIYEAARSYENLLYRVARKRHVCPVLIMQSIADMAKYDDTEEIIKNTETFLFFKHNHRDKKYMQDVTGITEAQADVIINLGGDIKSKEKKRPGELCLVDVPTNKVVFLKATYLKKSEQSIVETDMEVIASQWA